MANVICSSIFDTKHTFATYKFSIHLHISEKSSTFVGEDF